MYEYDSCYVICVCVCVCTLRRKGRQLNIGGFVDNVNELTSSCAHSKIQFKTKWIVIIHHIHSEWTLLQQHKRHRINEFKQAIFRICVAFFLNFLFFLSTNQVCVHSEEWRVFYHKFNTIFNKFFDYLMNVYKLLIILIHENKNEPWKWFRM